MFVELSKAWQLSAIEESTIQEVISEVATKSHSLLIFSAVELLNQAKLSSLQLRDKQISVVTSLSQLSTAHSLRFVFAQLSSICYQAVVNWMPGVQLHHSNNTAVSML